MCPSSTDKKEAESSRHDHNTRRRDADAENSVVDEPPPRRNNRSNIDGTASATEEETAADKWWREIQDNQTVVSEVTFKSNSLFQGPLYEESLATALDTTTDVTDDDIDSAFNRASTCSNSSSKAAAVATTATRKQEDQDSSQVPSKTSISGTASATEEETTADKWWREIQDVVQPLPSTNDVSGVAARCRRGPGAYAEGGPGQQEHQRRRLSPVHNCHEMLTRADERECINNSEAAAAAAAAATVGQEESSASFVTDEAPPTVVAKLVVEDDDGDATKTEAAQRQIKLLKQQLEHLRAKQRGQVVLAEPVLLRSDGSGSISSSNGSHRQTKKKAITVDPNHSEAMAIYEPAQGLHHQIKNHDDHCSRSSSSKHLLTTTSLELYGRDQEMSILRECLNKTQQKQLVMISGHSGCGKTTLAMSLRPVVTLDSKKQGLFVSGKYDLYLRDQPYSGIISACQEICTSILGLGRRSFRDIHDQLTTALSPQHVQSLSKVVPQFQEIMGSWNDDDDCPAASAMDQGHASEAKHRFHQAFCIFIRVASSYFGSFVIMLDDLQWADSSSLELIQAILADQDNPSFLMIGLYRSNEVCAEGGAGLESHLLTSFLRELRERQEDSNLEITELEIGNLDQEAAQSVLMDLLFIETVTPQVIQLAAVCHKRTLGNAFFLVSFVSMLVDEGLLEYDTSSASYTWDIDMIMSQTDATSNLVDLMRSKMIKLSTELGQLLSLAACLGSSVEQSKLELIWQLCDSSNTNHQDGTALGERLSIAVEEGFLEHLKSEPSKYRFIHDKVQEAAFSLIPIEEVSSFKFQVGNILCKEMDDVELQEDLFLVVNLLNETQKVPPDGDNIIRLAELNLQATKKAISCSAFSSAAHYASKGLEYLPDDRWKSHHCLTLDLCSCAVESNEVLGRHETMIVHCNEVLAQPQCPVLDKVRVYSAMGAQLATIGKHAEAVELLVKVLSCLGCKFPKSRTSRIVSTLLGVNKLRRRAKRCTSKAMEAISIMEDQSKIAIMKLLDKLATCAYEMGSDIFPLIVIKMASLSLKHGVSDLSPSTFAIVAGPMLTGVVGDSHAGSCLGKCALQLEQKLRCGSARTKSILGTYMFSWVHPLKEACSLLLDGYSEGIISGDTESATFAILDYTILCGIAGQPLKKVEADCSLYHKQMITLGRKTAAAYEVLTWQAVQNMMGIPDDPTLIQGDVLTDLEKFIGDNSDNKGMIAMLRVYQLSLLVLYGEFQKAAHHFQSHGYDLHEAGPAHPLFMDAIFYGGIASFELARSNGKRRFKRLAMKARSTVKGWIRQNNPNVAHHEAIFDAELAALQGKNKKAEMHYQSAIAVAFRGGFIHHAALANERYTEFILSVSGNRDCASFQIQEAIKLYTDWGAAKKVLLLQEKYSFLLSHNT